MLHFNNLFNFITSRLVFAQNAAPRLSDDPLAGDIDLSSKAPEIKEKDAEKPKESKRKAEETTEQARQKAQEETQKEKAKYNRVKFEHEVYRAKAEVEEKVESQMGGLMKDIREAVNPSEAEFHYGRAQKTFENMKNEMDALEFIAKGVDPDTIPADSEYSRMFRETVRDLTDKARKMERDSHPEIGGLTFDQIIKIMIAARKVHYKRYTLEDFETAKLERQKELKAEGVETDAELASLLGETPEKGGRTPEEEAIIAANEPESAATESLYASRGVFRGKMEAGARKVLEKATPANIRMMGLDIKNVSGAITSMMEKGEPVTRDSIERVMKIRQSAESNLIYGIAMRLEYSKGDNPAQLIYNELAALTPEYKLKELDEQLKNIGNIGIKEYASA